MKEVTLLESKDIREQAINRVEVLDKVKKLFLIPQLDVMTIVQVAEYYEVDVETIRKVYQRHKNEIDSDGSMLKSIKDFLIGKDFSLEENNTNGLKSQDVTLKENGLNTGFEIIKTEKGKVTIKISDNMVLAIPNRGIRCFTKRSILRTGMLLRDSKIAKEVRTQLLNIFGNSTQEQHTKEIDNEKELYITYAQAAIDGDKQALIEAANSVFQFKNKHINALEKHNAELAENNDVLAKNNKALAEEILKWSDRACVNKAVRLIAGKCNLPFGYIWKELYDELLYKHKICLNKRGKAPYIQYIKENEWCNVQKTLSAICEKRGLNASVIFKQSKMNGAA